MNQETKLLVLLLLISWSGRNLAATLNVKLSVQTDNFTNGPENMGIGLVSILNFSLTN